MTVGNTAIDPRFQRVGVISPNLAYGLDWPADSDHGEAVWPLESIAKKVSLLFDRIYLTHDLDVTCEIVGGYAENTETATRGEAGLSGSSRNLETHLRFYRSSAFRQSNVAYGLHAVV
jgi:hypothetical protein